MKMAMLMVGAALALAAFLGRFSTVVTDTGLDGGAVVVVQTDRWTGRVYGRYLIPKEHLEWRRIDQ